MNYIDVVSKFSYPNSKFDFFSLIIDLSDGVLVSLIEICRKKGVDDFHFDADKVLDFSVNYLDNHRKELWIDSGGFNLLSKYKLSEELLSVYMDKYFDQLSQQIDSFEGLFSLDLPIAKVISGVDNSWFNSIENVRKWNFESQSRAVILN